MEKIWMAPNLARARGLTDSDMHSAQTCSKPKATKRHLRHAAIEGPNETVTVETWLQDRYGIAIVRNEVVETVCMASLR